MREKQNREKSDQLYRVLSHNRHIHSATSCGQFINTNVYTFTRDSADHKSPAYIVNAACARRPISITQFTAF